MSLRKHVRPLGLAALGFVGLGLTLFASACTIEETGGSTTSAGAGGGGTGGSGGMADTGGPPGTACWVDDDCLGGICWTPKGAGMPGGYCVIEGCTEGSCPEGSACVGFNDGVDRCVDSCADNTECRESEGYVCESSGVCWPGTGTVPPGGSCGSDDHCMGGENALCIQQTGFLGGYCVITDCAAGTCPAGSECRAVFTSGGSGCIGIPGSAEGCRPGYAYNEDSSSQWFGGCYPGCGTDVDCPGDFGCRDSGTGSGSLICLDVSHECGPNNHTGDCAAGQVCNGGVCAPFECNDTLYEPNETQAGAVELPAEDTGGLQICNGDHDWFTITPTEANTLYQVGIDSNLASGNLDVMLTDAAGTVSNAAGMAADFYHEDGALGPTNMEIHGLMGAPGSAPSFLHVLGTGSLTQNNYGLVVRKIAWEDGPDCPALFGALDCAGKNAQGGNDSSKLMVFPVGNAADPYIGDGVYFDNGLSAFGNDAYTSSARLWSRRELVMAIRHAIHSVQENFPGTAPISLGDISMPDGTTPEGHPYGTHYLGANIDIAYYIHPDYHGTYGNLSYRQICCDANLNDWSCVDTNTSSPGYGQCQAGSESTHIVDIPRTAHFIAKLAGTGRIRVIGTEAKVEALLEAELDAQVDSGLITSTERTVGKSVMQTANDHGSWIWHFNHLHVSFKSEAEVSSAKSFQGPWPNMEPEEQAERMRAYPWRIPNASMPLPVPSHPGQHLPGIHHAH